HAVSHSREERLLSVSPFIEQLNRLALSFGVHDGKLAVRPSTEIDRNDPRLATLVSACQNDRRRQRAGGSRKPRHVAPRSPTYRPGRALRQVLPLMPRTPTASTSRTARTLPISGIIRAGNLQASF